VILIIVDCLRADHLSFNGYPRQTTPFLARLYAEGRLRQVAEARSSCNCSQGGIMSTLASRDFEDLGQGLFLVHDVLRGQGYKIHFILSAYHSAEYNLRDLYGENIDIYFDGVATQRYFGTDDRLLFEGLEKVAPADGQPAFFYFHLMSAHDIGIRLPEYSPWQPMLTKLWENPLLVQADRQARVNTYDNGVRMADATIERLLAELDRKGYFRHSLVMILGDHGQALGEHGFYGHANRKPLYEEQLRIPLLILDEPEVEYRNLSSALQLDVAPTIVDRLALPVPKTWRGQSLLKPDERRVSFHHEAREDGGRAVVYRDGGKVWKYISSGSADAGELYELRSDPGEKKNLAGEKEAAAILDHLRELMRNQR
jgi:arylsulfatase A-like enzyme